MNNTLTHEEERVWLECSRSDDDDDDGNADGRKQPADPTRPNDGR